MEKKATVLRDSGKLTEGDEVTVVREVPSATKGMADMAYHVRRADGVEELMFPEELEVEA